MPFGSVASSVNVERTQPALVASDRSCATYTHISLPYTHIFIDTYNTAGNSGFRTREAPDGADFHVGKYPTGHKTQILQFHQRDSPDLESLLGGNRWTHYRSFTTQLNRHRSIPTETLHRTRRAGDRGACGREPSRRARGRAWRAAGVCQRLWHIFCVGRRPQSRHT